ncbi:hypothetical protein GGP41_003683 [Bipolaris sorokiniana]|uniref:Uncharacterized protein n=2 Tax=Cochliobolus sativus TaxID=45130 RepID=A0A8H6DSJ9_COCSA|nr:uncharacterized protein COCSADRAFT_88990 [Bipolaris sorokiniana ND90Pr]EMD65036.1 hypothetical protein COCSADRAFT_88990 [Bipolaris sorokiniana ND90Pr]KAF5846273.1 hypothetical protein GGP41_003683 [Bipolaris sorokiniana]
MGKRSQTTNCTHVDMDRVYGHDQQCSVCGCSSSIGFLYQCKQDNETEHLSDLISRNTSNIMPVKSRLRKELERAGLSESIIIAAESGHYTNQQLQKLKQMKRELQHTIIDVQQADQANDAISRLMDMAMAPCGTDGAMSSLLPADTEPSGCNFKACHGCRPYYLDRVYISFGAVVAGEFSPLTRADIAKLPVRPAATMHNIGMRRRPLPSSRTSNATPSTRATFNSPATSTNLRHSPSSNTTDSSATTFQTSQTDLDEIATRRRPRLNFYKIGRLPSNNLASSRSSPLLPQGFKTTIQGMFRYNRDPSSTSTSTTWDTANSTSTSTSSCKTTRVRRPRRENKHHNHPQIPPTSSSSADSAISTNSAFKLYPLEKEAHTRVTSTGRTHTARMHIPDVATITLTDPASRLAKSGAVVRTREVTGEVQGQRRGVQSVMTQV